MPAIDASGADTDVTGRARNWWTDADRAAFAKVSQCVVDQYEGRGEVLSRADREHPEHDGLFVELAEHPQISGRRERLGYEVRWRPGPASIKAEYIRVTDERVEQSVEDTDLSPFLAKGWYVSGTFALTGEKKADGLDVPRRPLFRGGIGAVELALRQEEMTFGSQASDDVPSTSPRADVTLSNSDRVTTFGVNWYLNRWVKIQFNVIRDKLSDPSQGPLPSQPVIWNRVLRFQFQL